MYVYLGHHSKLLNGSGVFCAGYVLGMQSKASIQPPHLEANPNAYVFAYTYTPIQTALHICGLLHARVSLGPSLGSLWWGPRGGTFRQGRKQIRKGPNTGSPGCGTDPHGPCSCTQTRHHFFRRLVTTLRRLCHGDWRGERAADRLLTNAAESNQKYIAQKRLQACTHVPPRRYRSGSQQPLDLLTDCPSTATYAVYHASYKRPLHQASQRDDFATVVAIACYQTLPLLSAQHPARRHPLPWQTPQ